MQRSKALQIYMKPGLSEDDLMLHVWNACKRHSRPQEVFRAMLRAGLRAMVESGELADDVIRECRLEGHFEDRHRRDARGHGDHLHPQVPPQPVAYPPMPYPAQYHPAAYQQPYAPAPAPVPPAATPMHQPVAVSDPAPTQIAPRPVRETPAPAANERPPAPPAKAPEAGKGAAGGKRIGELM